jgi:hypothetical protein
MNNIIQERQNRRDGRGGRVGVIDFISGLRP